MRPLVLLALASIAIAEDYPLGPDSQPQPGVPQGEVKKFAFETSKLFPGTKRDWCLYIPKQYDAAKPACAMVFFDGGGFVKTTANSACPSCSTI